MESGKENIINHSYADAETFRLVDAICVESGMNQNDVWERYGEFLIEYTMELGWDELLRTLSADLRGFLDNLDSLHYFIDNVVYKADLQGPSFRCESGGEGALILHYYSSRSGLYPIVKGVLRAVAQRVFNMSINITVGGRNQRIVQMANGERLEEHVTFTITVGEGDVDARSRFSSVCDSEGTELMMESLELSNLDMSVNIPYHILVDRDCKILHYGAGFRRHFGRDQFDIGVPIHRAFSLKRPKVPLDFENIVSFINAVFVLEARQSSSARRDSAIPDCDDASSVGELSAHVPLALKGQMILLNDCEHLLYLCSPYVTDVPALLRHNLRLNQLPLYDVTRDLILLNQQRLKEVDINRQLDEAKDQMNKMTEEMDEEKCKAEALLSQVLPSSVAKQLMNGVVVEPCSYDEVTVIFSDVPEFVNIVPLTPPKDIVLLLNELFTRFDRLVSIHDVYKVETINDSYMIVSGAPLTRSDHSEAACYVALGFLWESMGVHDPINNCSIGVRVGIHTGPIVAGVVGKKMPRYCLFGDTVNTASRMESHGKPHCIHCSSTAYGAAQVTGRFKFKERGTVQIKGKGPMRTYWLIGSLKKSLWEIVDHKRGLLTEKNAHA